MAEGIFRHEYKYEINAMDYEVLKSRLKHVMKSDCHTDKYGKYRIRNIYFDTPEDRALMEKINGVSRREKFRLRYYNEDIFHIRLEKKSKYKNLCQKVSVWVSYEECTRILANEIEWMRKDERELLRELYGKMKSTGLRPKTISCYERIPFVYGPGNVRITLDSEMRTGVYSRDFLHMECVPMIYSGGMKRYLLEVKYDAFLPGHVRSMIQLGSRSPVAYSKYADSRSFG